MDPKGKTIVITGASSGIGAAAAKILSQKGAKLIITGRSDKTKKIADELNCDYYLVDYARFKDVIVFAKSLLKTHPRIDVLVNNVGGVFADRRITEDGNELTLQVNHLSGFLLTLLLKERLEESKAIVINTSSQVNTMGQIDFDDLQSEKKYDEHRVYGTTKLMNILHAMEISRRYKDVNAASFHPGGVATGFGREGGKLVKMVYESPLRHLFLISPKKGADTLIWLITSTPGKDWKPGEYYAKRKPAKKNPQVSESMARKMWDASEKLVNSSRH